jgi:hypothetical protein
MSELGVKGVKPRFKPAKEELPELSRKYLEIRNEQMRTKNLAAQMVLAERRGELIEKKLVEQQAAYLLVALRQRILQVPHAYARRILGLTDANAAKAMLHEMAISLLNDLKDRPAKVTNPHWLEELDAGPPFEQEKPLTPTQAAAKAKRRK